MPDLDPDREQQRLQELDEQIDQARRHAQDDIADIPDPDERRFVDSGEESRRDDGDGGVDDRDDDQTIAPPG